MTVVVPTTPIIGLYEELHRKGVSREQKLARARGFVANPASLAVMFHDSVLRLATYKPTDEGFYKSRKHYAVGDVKAGLRSFSWMIMCALGSRGASSGRQRDAAPHQNVRAVQQLCPFRCLVPAAFTA